MEPFLSSYSLATSGITRTLNLSMLPLHYILTFTILLLSGSLLYAQDPVESSMSNFKDTSQAVSTKGSGNGLLVLYNDVHSLIKRIERIDKCFFTMTLLDQKR